MFDISNHPLHSTDLTSCPEVTDITHVNIKHILPCMPWVKFMMSQISYAVTTPNIYRVFQKSKIFEILFLEKLHNPFNIKKMFILEKNFETLGEIWVLLLWHLGKFFQTWKKWVLYLWYVPLFSWIFYAKVFWNPFKEI